MILIVVIKYNNLHGKCFLTKHVCTIVGSIFFIFLRKNSTKKYLNLYLNNHVLVDNSI